MSSRSVDGANRSEAGGFRTPLAAAAAEMGRKGSRFLAHLVPAADEADAERALSDIRAAHPEATHHCWARRLGWPPRERSSDAGEPSGTAGKPILFVLQGQGISDALLVVSRWFGGTKLGRGGLARAYAAAAGRVIAAAALAEKLPMRRYRLSAPYSRMGPVQRLLGAPGVVIVRQAFGERLEIELTVEAPRASLLEAAAGDLGADVTWAEIRS